MYISENDKQYLLSLKPEDLTHTLFRKLFANTTSVEKGVGKRIPARFNTTDQMILYPADYFVKEKTDTTVGRFIYNKYIVEYLGLQEILGYVNDVLTDKNNSKLEAKLSKALIEDKISVPLFHQYINVRDNLGMQMNFMLAASLTPKTSVVLPQVAKERDKLFKEHEKELANGNIELAEKIEKHLLGMAREILKDDPGLAIYESEARSSFENYKNIFIFRGAVKNNMTGKYDIVKSSFSEGIAKEDIATMASSVVAGAYPKAVGTQESGYRAKQILAAMQSSVVGEKGSNCGTQKYLLHLVTEDDIKSSAIDYRYILDGGKLVRLDPSILPRYVGKEVKLRSDMYCLADNTCNMCAGDAPYLLDKLNIGLDCSRVATTLLKLGMKQFHVSGLKSSRIDLNDIFL